jgi:hypothetical protein
VGKESELSRKYKVCENQENFEFPLKILDKIKEILGFEDSNSRIKPRLFGF